MNLRPASRRSSADGPRRFWPMLFAFLLAIPMMLSSFSGLATADVGDPEYLTVTKSVDDAKLEPGEVFTYLVEVTCSEASCLEANLTDNLPAELEGFALQNASFTPGEATIPRTVTWTEDGAELGSAPGVVGANTTVRVDFTGETTAPDGVGLQFGQTFTMALSLQVPEMGYTEPYDITNTAENHQHR